MRLHGWHYQNTGYVEEVTGLGTSIKATRTQNLAHVPNSPL